MAKTLQALALAFCCFFLLAGSTYGFRRAKVQQAAGGSAPVYYFSNGTQVPADQVASLLADPNTQVVNNTEENPESAQPAAAQTQAAAQPTATNTAPATESGESTPVYYFQNGTQVPADQVAALLANPNTTVVNQTNNGADASAPAEQAEATAPAQTETTAPVQTQATAPVQTEAVESVPVAQTTLPTQTAVTAPVQSTPLATPVDTTAVPVSAGVAPLGAGLTGGIGGLGLEGLGGINTLGGLGGAGLGVESIGGLDFLGDNGLDAGFGNFLGGGIPFYTYPSAFYGGNFLGGLNTGFTYGNGLSFGSAFSSPAFTSIPQFSYGASPYLGYY